MGTSGFITLLFFNSECFINYLSCLILQGSQLVIFTKTSKQSLGCFLGQDSVRLLAASRAGLVRQRQNLASQEAKAEWRVKNGGALGTSTHTPILLPLLQLGLRPARPGQLLPPFHQPSVCSHQPVLRSNL